jgi:hypothetical protein
MARTVHCVKFNKADELDESFFGEGSQLPPDYNPAKTK